MVRSGAVTSSRCMIYFGILIAFLVVILLNKELCPVYHVRGQLVVLQEPNTVLQVFPLPFLHADIVDLRHTRALGQLDAQVDLVAHHAVRLNGHVGEQAIAPETLDGVGDFLARDTYPLAHRKSRQADEHVVVIVLRSFHRDASDGIQAGHARIFHRGVDLLLVGLRLHGRNSGTHYYRCKKNALYCFHTLVLLILQPLVHWSFRTGAPWTDNRQWLSSTPPH